MTAVTAAPTALDAHSRKEIAEVLARSFHDDPLFQFVVPDEAHRARVLRRLFPGALRLGSRYGEVMTAEGAGGAAIWLSPEHVTPGLLQNLRAGMWAWPFTFGLRTFGRIAGVMDHIEKLHKRDFADTPHWYLMVLGIDPPHQGRGAGGALLERKLAQLDGEGLLGYLETTKERNVPFYRRHGFEVVVEGVFSGGGPRYWTMKREPRAARS